MNGNSRLYRSTSDAMIGGVAAGLGNYFKFDPTIIRAAFVILTLATGGAFLLVYLALWLLIPSVGSTAGQPNDIVRENLNEMGDKVRSFVSGGATNGGNGGNGGSNGSNGNPTATNGGPGATYNQAQLPQGGSTAQARQGATPMVLIVIGLLFLMANFGFFHMIHWGVWWPLMLIGLGVIMLTRRNR